MCDRLMKAMNEITFLSIGVRCDGGGGVGVKCIFKLSIGKKRR